MQTKVPLGAKTKTPGEVSREIEMVELRRVVRNNGRAILCMQLTAGYDKHFPTSCSVVRIETREEYSSRRAPSFKSTPISTKVSSIKTIKKYGA